MDNESSSVEPVVSRVECESPSVGPVKRNNLDRDRVTTGMENEIGRSSKTSKLNSTKRLNKIVHKRNNGTRELLQHAQKMKKFIRCS